MPISGGSENGKTVGPGATVIRKPFDEVICARPVHLGLAEVARDMATCADGAR